MINEEIISMFSNKIVLSCLITIAVTQSTKFFTSAYNTKKYNIASLLQSGGMPSTHTSLVTALTFSILLNEGLTSLFIASFVFSAIVIRDALGVRWETGIHARIINNIIRALRLKKKLGSKELKELIGHTPFQVIIGFLYGVVISFGVWVL